MPEVPSDTCMPASPFLQPSAPAEQGIKHVVNAHSLITESSNMIAAAIAPVTIIQEEPEVIFPGVDQPSVSPPSVSATVVPDSSDADAKCTALTEPCSS